MIYGDIEGKGFIHHPTLAPNISGIAVFHELHCLVFSPSPHPPIPSSAYLPTNPYFQNGIRQAYYSSLNKNMPPDTTTDPNSAFLLGDTHLTAHNLARQQREHDQDDPAHIRHCFDYLRHALMCFSDTNLEPVNWELRGVTGWGSERMCRDYGAVKGFAERWRMRGEGVVD